MTIRVSPSTFLHIAYHRLMVIAVGGHVYSLSAHSAVIPDLVVIYGLVVAFCKSRPLDLLLVILLCLLVYPMVYLSFTTQCCLQGPTFHVASLPITPYLSCYLVAYKALPFTLPLLLPLFCNLSKS